MIFFNEFKCQSVQDEENSIRHLEETQTLLHESYEIWCETILVIVSSSNI